jgi:hypothetical protein
MKRAPRMGRRTFFSFCARGLVICLDYVISDEPDSLLVTQFAHSLVILDQHHTSRGRVDLTKKSLEALLVGQLSRMGLDAKIAPSILAGNINPRLSFDPQLTLS